MLEKQEESEQFVVDSLAKANWTMKKIAEKKRQMSEIDKAANEQIDAVVAWRDKELETLGKDVEYLTYLMQDWTFSEAEKRGKKTINLVCGKVKVAKSPDSWSFGGEKASKDNEKMIAWLEEHAAEYVKEKTETFADWVNFKRSLDPQDDGRVVSKETGEVIPGLTFTAGVPIVKVEVDNE